MTSKALTRARGVAMAALLLVALAAGSASAGALITSKQIKDGSVTGADLRDGTLTGRDIKDGSLSPLDLLGAMWGPTGEVGAPGIPGPNGIPGLFYRSAPRTISTGTQLSWTVLCDTGKTAVGGGVSTTRPDLVTITRSSPDGEHWAIGVANNHSGDVRAIGWAVCAPIP